jgi:hypothetical protein
MKRSHAMPMWLTASHEAMAGGKKSGIIFHKMSDMADTEIKRRPDCNQPANVL